MGENSNKDRVKLFFILKRNLSLTAAVLTNAKIYPAVRSYSRCSLLFYTMRQTPCYKQKRLRTALLNRVLFTHLYLILADNTIQIYCWNPVWSI